MQCLGGSEARRRSHIIQADHNRGLRCVSDVHCGPQALKCTDRFGVEYLSGAKPSGVFADGFVIQLDCVSPARRAIGEL